MISLTNYLKQKYQERQEQIREDCKKRGMVFPVRLLAVDMNTYKKYKNDLIRLPMLSDTSLDSVSSMENNLYDLSTREVADIVVYYHMGKFREWVTGLPILGICESMECDFFSNRLFSFNIPYGKMEPIFFKFAKARNLFDYGCTDKLDKVLYTVSDEYLTAYESMHKDKDKYKAELTKLKSQAMLDYCDVLLLYDQYKRQEENKHLIKRVYGIQQIICQKEEV